MTDLSHLKARVERAKGPDRELDCRIAYALGMNWRNPKWSHSLHNWRQHVKTHGFEAAWTSDHVYRQGYDCPPPEDYSGSLIPNWTASVDAALALVERLLPGTWVEGSLASPSCLEIHSPGRWDYLGQGRAATPALAILSALLTALPLSDKE